MKDKFITHQFSPTGEDLLVKSNRIIAEYRRQGLVLTLRQLYYQMVSRDFLPLEWADPKTGSTNNPKSYKRFGDLISNARLAGLVDWAMLEDRGRKVHKPQTWDKGTDFLERAHLWYRRDYWADQGQHIEVMVEKDALAGVLSPVCWQYQVPFTANRGYSSSSALYEAAQRIAEMVENDRKVTVLYLGDHDPSGIDMTRDIRDRLTLLSREAPFEVVRLALNYDQVQQYHPPENPAKETDSRHAVYAAQFGDSSWELDALNPATLSGLVENAIRSHIDQAAWQRSTDRQEEIRRELEHFFGGYSDF